MSAPLCPDLRLILKRSLAEFDQLKNIRVGGAEHHEETQTTKLNGTGLKGAGVATLVLKSYLSFILIRLTNLIRNVRY